nr:transposase [Pseudoalteromonas prydzensis]
MFRGKFINALQQSNYHLPANTPTSWVADVKYVGHGDKALTYLARYLYRGVINEQNIIENQHGNVTFRYRDSATKQDKYITEPACDFIWRVLKHVLPKGFQRTRNSGFFFLFKADNLAKVFRGKFINALQQSGYHLPVNTPSSWVADVQYVGQGDKALTYLARYLYRGVINEQNIIENQHGNVTFRYRDSATKQDKYITESGCDFLWRVLKHVLPKGFQRTRNSGFLHGNAKRTLQRIQLLLKMQLPPLINTAKSSVCCPHCNAHMTLYLARIGRHIIGQNHLAGLSI